MTAALKPNSGENDPYSRDKLSALDFGMVLSDFLSMHLTTPNTTAPKGRGRPREFDMDKALDEAVRVFRERGYHATSLADLMQATSLASGSIYKAFKDKKAVFAAAFDRYVSEREQLRRMTANADSTGLEKLRRLLENYVLASSGAEGKRGCLVVGSVVELMTLDEETAGRIKSALGRNETFLADLIREGQGDGSIAGELDAAAAARLLLCVMQGMRVIGKTGRTRHEMDAVAELTLQAIGLSPAASSA